jgi:hypothetical protein
MEPVIYDLAALFPDTPFPNIRGENQWTPKLRA